MVVTLSLFLLFQQPIHLMIMTDDLSVTYVRSIVEKFIWRDVTMQNKTLDISYDFFNVDTIVEHFYDEIQVLFCQPFFKETGSSKKLDRFVSKKSVSLFVKRSSFLVPSSTILVVDIDSRCSGLTLLQFRRLPGNIETTCSWSRRFITGSLMTSHILNQV